MCHEREGLGSEKVTVLELLLGTAISRSLTSADAQEGRLEGKGSLRQEGIQERDPPTQKADWSLRRPHLRGLQATHYEGQWSWEIQIWAMHSCQLRTIVQSRKVAERLVPLTSCEIRMKREKRCQTTLSSHPNSCHLPCCLTV